jgi:hypothetical protein
MRNAMDGDKVLSSRFFLTKPFIALVVVFTESLSPLNFPSESLRIIDKKSKLHSPLKKQFLCNELYMRTTKKTS